MKEMSQEELTKIFEENEFNVLLMYDDVQSVEIETWTNNGVNMYFYLNPFTIKEFKKYVESFNVDEEIDLLRQDPLFRENFTIKESLEDFEGFHKKLKGMLSLLD